MRPITAPESWESAGVAVHGLAPDSRLAPGNVRQRTQSRARRRLPRAPSALDGRPRATRPRRAGRASSAGASARRFSGPHHGGRTANPEWLYEWAKPRLVVVSQRPVRRQGGDALAPLERRGIPLLRTWRQGSIRLRWTDDGIVTRSFLDNQRKCHRITVRKNDRCRDARLAVTLCRHDHVSGRYAARDRLHGIRARGDRLSRSGGDRVRGLGADRASPIDRLRRFSGRGRRRAASRNVRESRSRFEASDGARLAGRWLPAPGPLVTGRTTLFFTGSPKLRRCSRHAAPPP